MFSVSAPRQFAGLLLRATQQKRHPLPSCWVWGAVNGAAGLGTGPSGCHLYFVGEGRALGITTSGSSIDATQPHPSSPHGPPPPPHTPRSPSRVRRTSTGAGGCGTGRILVRQNLAPDNCAELFWWCLTFAAILQDPTLVPLPVTSVAGVFAPVLQQGTLRMLSSMGSSRMGRRSNRLVVP